MKKLFCLLLVLICLPIVSYCDEVDPIIGCWYLYYNLSETPELKSAFPDHDQVIAIYIFGENGTIYCTGAQISNWNGVPEFTIAGRWKKDDSSYYVSIVGMGENIDAFIEDDCLFLEIQNSIYYLKIKKMFAFNPYQDYVWIKK